MLVSLILLSNLKGKVTYEIETDRCENQREEQDLTIEEDTHLLMKVTSPGVDSEARWIRKAGKVRYGYKKHYVCDPEGLVMGVHTTAANVNEISNLKRY